MKAQIACSFCLRMVLSCPPTNHSHWFPAYCNHSHWFPAYCHHSHWFPAYCTLPMASSIQLSMYQAYTSHGFQHMYIVHVPWLLLQQMHTFRIVSIVYTVRLWFLQQPFCASYTSSRSILIHYLHKDIYTFRTLYNVQCTYVVQEQISIFIFTICAVSDLHSLPFLYFLNPLMGPLCILDYIYRPIWRRQASIVQSVAQADCICATWWGEGRGGGVGGGVIPSYNNTTRS